MKVSEIGKNWVLMLALNVGAILVVAVLMMSTGYAPVAALWIALLLIFNHFASVPAMQRSTGDRVQHYVGLVLLGMICLVATNAGQRVSLWVLPLASGIGVMFVLALLNLYPGTRENSPGEQ